MDIGTRVVRGPDWTYGKTDGGEGHLGTVVKLCGQSMCDVIWDNGYRHRYRAGTGDKFDLLVLDTGPTGLEHSGILCDGCDVFGIPGTRWTCTTCRSCHLCTVCYGNAKHDIAHDFIRFDTPGCKGVHVSPRRSSIRMHGTGLFQNAKVKKGPDWSSGMNHGTAPGKIVAVENHPSGASVRSMVRVEWEGGEAGLYKAGHEGKVDVQYITEYPGIFYYRDHLGSFTVAETKLQQDTASLLGKANREKSKMKRHFSPGDKVCVKVSLEKLQELQTKANIWHQNLRRLSTRFGKVKSYTEAGHVQVAFEGLFGSLFGDNVFSVCEEALIKVPIVREEDIVRISSNENEVKILQNGHGSHTVDMNLALGKLGRVRKVMDSGDIVVSFGPSALQFNPAVCTPAPGAKEDNIKDDLAEKLESTEIEFGNHMDMETQIDGVPTTDRGLIEKADVMFDAFSRENFGLFMAILKLDPRLKRILHKGHTPMILASATGASELVKMLIREGVDMNAKDADSQTPLLHAIYREQDETVPLLINSGCDVNLAGKRGITPFHLSVITEKEDYVELLLQKNAEVNKKDDAGNTAAHIAIELDQSKIMAIILKCARFDPRVTNSRNFNILQFATIKGGASYVEMILAKYPQLVEEAMPETGFTALHIAANNNHTDCIRILIQKGHAKVNVQNTQGMTPLILACVNMFDDSVALLLQNGADAKLTDDAGDTPLHYALRSQLMMAILTSMTLDAEEIGRKRLRIARMLLERGADLDRRNLMGITAIDVAVSDTVRQEVFKKRREIQQSVRKHETTDSDSKCKRDSPKATSGVPSTSTDPSPGPSSMSLPCAKCINNMVDVELRPCGHRLICKACVSTVEQCPLCTRNILAVAELSESKQSEENCKMQ